MKKLTQNLIGLLLITLVFNGCTTDDIADLIDVNSPLVGTTWTFTSKTVSSCTDPANDETSSCSTSCDTILFNSDGTITFTGSNSPTGTVTYTYTDTVISASFDDNGTQVTENINYTILLNELILTFAADDSNGCVSVETYTGS
ncbi:MAG: hypothetical protein OEX22_05275 [Cyclobacteriaceae bacterium]|nr:hypothetical protein [Cyclobacteriaceae bacterium]